MTSTILVLLYLRVSNVFEKVMLYRITEVRISLCFIKKPQISIPMYLVKTDIPKIKTQVKTNKWQVKSKENILCLKDVQKTSTLSTPTV